MESRIFLDVVRRTTCRVETPGKIINFIFTAKCQKVPTQSFFRLLLSLQVKMNNNMWASVDSKHIICAEQQRRRTVAKSEMERKEQHGSSQPGQINATPQQHSDYHYPSSCCLQHLVRSSIKNGTSSRERKRTRERSERADTALWLTKSVFGSWGKMTIKKCYKIQYIPWWSASPWSASQGSCVSKPPSRGAPCPWVSPGKFVNAPAWNKHDEHGIKNKPNCSAGKNIAFQKSTPVNERGRGFCLFSLFCSYII